MKGAGRLLEVELLEFDTGSSEEEGPLEEELLLLLLALAVPLSEEGLLLELIAVSSVHISYLVFV